jgi:hypothetical protein
MQFRYKTEVQPFFFRTPVWVHAVTVVQHLSKLLPVTQIHTKTPLARPNGIDSTLTSAQMRVMQLRGCYERRNVALGKEKG